MMSKGGENGGSEGPNIFMWEDQLWNFSLSDNSGRNEQKESKNTLPSNPDSLVGHAAGEKEREGGTLKGSSSKGGRGENPDGHDVHIQTERERRRRMSNMFSNLHSFLPHLSAKADKSTIVEEAINYIKSLEQEVEQLEKQKLERLQGASAVSFFEAPAAVAVTREAFLADLRAAAEPESPTLAPIPEFTTDFFRTWTSANVTLNVNGEDGHISICTAKKPGLLSLVLAVMDKHQLELVTAHASSTYFRTMFMIHAHASRARFPFADMLMIEEIYKSAAEELMFLLNSTC